MRHRILMALGLVLACLITLSCKKSEEELEWEYGPFNYGQISSIQCNRGIVINLKKGTSTSNKIIRKTTGGPQITSYGGYMTMNGGGTIDLEVGESLGLSFNGGGGVQCKAEDSIRLKQLAVYGQAYGIRLYNITVDSALNVGLTNTGDGVITGKTLYLGVTTSNLSRFFGFGLVADTCVVSHSGISDMQVNAKYKLAGGVFSIGNLFYKGNPPIMEAVTVGGGTNRVIHQPD